MLLAFYGGGKGKTSAALGIVLRSWGHGMRVLYVGLMKTPFYQGEEVGEYKAMRRMGVDVLYLPDFKSPAEGLRRALELAEGYDLVVLDELFYAVRQGLLPSSALALLSNVKPHVVATGNYWEPGFADFFDLVTRLEEVKHYYRRGVLAVRGVDW
ncbi:MAG: cob(I)yrinic acid a,c-diamide adenosyltransferase [Pyrobaculum sp.]